MHKAEVIAIGSELLGSTRLDTNSLYLAERLASLGIELRSKTVVGDSRSEVAEHLRRALDRADVVILTGGLGPTDDDVTRDALADVLGRPLIEHHDIVERLVQRFARRGFTMPDVNRRQALVIQGGVVLENPNGTAPGQMVAVGHQLVILLPGPPRELRPMMDALVAGPLAARAGSERLFRTTLFTVGRGESHVEELVQPVYSKWLQATPPIETTILAAPGQIELHLVLRSSDAAAAASAPCACPRRDPRRARGGRLQYRWALDGRDCRAAPARAEAHDRGRRVVYGRADVVAANRHIRELRVCRWRGRRLQQRVEGESGWCSGGAHRRTRCRQRTGCGGARRRHSSPYRRIPGCRHHRHRRTVRRNAAQAGWHGGRCGLSRRRCDSGPHVPAPRFALDDQVPGGANGPRHGAPDSAGSLRGSLTERSYPRVVPATSLRAAHAERRKGFSAIRRASLLAVETLLSAQRAAQLRVPLS